MGEKAKTCLSKFDIKFLVFTFNLVSFHASSRLILHADVSYIIDIACHWSFFPILPVLATFWIAKTPIFFHFPTPNFCRTGTRRTYVHPFVLDYWAKTRYQPIFWHCLGAVLQYLAIFYENLLENLHYIPKSGLKTAKISTKSAMFRIQKLRNRC